jgi:hypothetical protein
MRWHRELYGWMSSTRSVLALVKYEFDDRLRWAGSASIKENDATLRSPRKRDTEIEGK